MMYTAQQETNYPTTSVITKYALFGGVVGSTLILIVVAAFLIFQFSTNFIDSMVNGASFTTFSLSELSLWASLRQLIGKIAQLIAFYFMFGFIGTVVGFIPALFTGVILNKKQVYRSKKGLITAFITGFVVTAIVLIGVMTINLFIDKQLDMSIISVDSIMPVLVAGAIGGSSALVLGRWVLPAPNIEFAGNDHA